VGRTEERGPHHREERAQLPAPTPAINPETKPFWDAAATGRLVLRRCTDCQSVIWYPRAICPDCWSGNTEWFDASGRGSIYSYTVNNKGEGPYRDAGPYVLAYVELDEGPRIMTNILTDDFAALEIGRRVEVTFSPTADGEAALPRFRLR
jgi:uncharacterized OB-fold protein